MESAIRILSANPQAKFRMGQPPCKLARRFGLQKEKLQDWLAHLLSHANGPYPRETF